MKVRALTWNIHGGVGRSGRFDLTAIVDLICRWNPDIVALQEVDSRRTVPGDVPAFQYIIDRIGFHAVEAKSILAADGEYGQLLVSRWTLGCTAVHDISVPGREPRRAVEAEIQSPAGSFQVVAAHFGLSFRERRSQAKALASIAAQRPCPTLVLGDFNDWIRGIVQGELGERFPVSTPHKTWPSRWPVLRLDRMYARPAGTLKESWTDPDGAVLSDHLPVIADFEIEVSSAS